MPARETRNTKGKAAAAPSPQESASDRPEGSAPRSESPASPHADRMQQVELRLDAQATHLKGLTRDTSLREDVA